MRRIKLFTLLLLTSLLLSSCAETSFVPVVEPGVMRLNASGNAADAIGEMGGFQGGHLMQTLPVKNEDFYLLIDYGIEEQSINDWRITSSKCLNVTVKTEGLPEGWRVYIDNVHIESSILSLYEAFDGIIVDEMDDHTHSSVYPGFAINNENEYYGVFGIGGYSQTLVSGYTEGFAAYNGMSYTSGRINEKRVTESELKEAGVYGNKFQLVYDLYIQPLDSGEPYMKSVISEFVIPTTFSVKITNDADRKVADGEALWNGVAFDIAAADGSEWEMFFADGEYVISPKATVPE